MVVAHPLVTAELLADMMRDVMHANDIRSAALTSGYEIARRPGLVEGNARTSRLPTIVR